jgi:oligopeptide transport system substrate-binding protein
MLRTLLVLIGVPLAGVLVWLAGGPRAQRADFVFAATEPRTVDPHRVSWLFEIQLAAAMFEGLTRLNDQTFQPEPAVAASWDTSADGRTWTFHLRPAARWSNGDPVTAEDFRFGWLRVLEPRTESQYAALLFTIAGAEAYYRARLDDDPGNDSPADTVGVAAPDPATLVVQLAGPCPYFLDLTSFVTFAPAHRPTLERWAYRDGRVARDTQHLWTRPEHIVTNGPFVLARWTFKEALLLRRNPHYWDAASIGMETIEAYIVVDPNAALIAYQTGRVDLVRGLERTVAATLQAEQAAGRRQDFHIADVFATFFYRVNCRRPPLNNADFRRALALALDRPAICDVLALGERPAYTYVPPAALPQMPRTAPDGGTVYYEPPPGLGAELAAPARQALARACLARSGFDPASRALEIAFPGGDPEQLRIAQLAQAMWSDVLGLRIELRQQEAKVLATRIRNLDYDLARSDWFGDYLDPGTFLDMFTTTSGQNRTGWSSPVYDRLIAAAARTTDNRERFALYRDAERLLCVDELPIVPVFFRRGDYLLNPRFTGLAPNLRDLLLIHRVRRE